MKRILAKVIRQQQLQQQNQPYQWTIGRTPRKIWTDGRIISTVRQMLLEHIRYTHKSTHTTTEWKRWNKNSRNQKSAKWTPNIQPRNRNTQHKSRWTVISMRSCKFLLLTQTHTGPIVGVLIFFGVFLSCYYCFGHTIRWLSKNTSRCEQSCTNGIWSIREEAYSGYRTRDQAR